MKLFKNHGGRRQRADRAALVSDIDDASTDDDAPVAAELALTNDEVDLALGKIGEHLGESHGVLDEIEGRLLALQERHEGLSEIDLRQRQASSNKRGRVETLDLRTLAELSEVDDDFNTRFDAFANDGQDDNAARLWLEGR